MTGEIAKVFPQVGVRWLLRLPKEQFPYRLVVEKYRPRTSNTPGMVLFGVTPGGGLETDALPEHVRQMSFDRYNELIKAGRLWRE